MQPDGNGHYFRNEIGDEEVETPDTPNSDAATAIVMNCAGQVQPDLFSERRHIGSLQSIVGNSPQCSSLQRHPPGGKRVLFIGGATPASSGAPGGGDQVLDSGDETEEWPHLQPQPQWDTPLVAACATRTPMTITRIESAMDQNRMTRGDSVCTDWTDSATKGGGSVSLGPEYSQQGLHGRGCGDRVGGGGGVGSNFHVGIYGWRKRCLYLLILALLVMVIVNLTLTLWVLKVMEFSAEGMGQLRVVAGGLELNGQAIVLDALVASNIRSRRGQHITIESSRNFSVNVRDQDGRMASKMYLGPERLECAASAFRVSDPRGDTLFSADKKEVVVGAKLLRVTGQGGAVFDGTVQTPVVRADSGSELRLESPTRSVEVRAPQGVAIESRAGDISASCLTDLKLQSVAGSIRLESARVFMPGLHTDVASGAKIRTGTGSPSTPSASRAGRRRDEIYQLCMCGNGKLFLSAAEGLCAADDDSAVCR